MSQQQSRNIIIRIVNVFLIGVCCFSFVLLPVDQVGAGSLAYAVQHSDSLNSTLVADRTDVDNSVEALTYDPVQALLDDAKQEYDEAVDTHEASASAEVSAGNQGNFAKKQDSANQAKAQDITAAVTPVKLFNTVDLFRKPIAGNAPQWERVINSEKKKNRFLARVQLQECLQMY